MSDEIIKTALEDYKRCADAAADNMEAWAVDVRFARVGEQWPDAVKKQREAEGRPCLTINKLPSFIRQVLNDARQNSPTIKCHPSSDGATEETAEIINGLIRQIEVQSDAETAYDTALDHAVTGGFGYFRISTDYAKNDGFDQDIIIERICNPLSVLPDPDSVSIDSSDWNVAFVIDTIPEADFIAKYPNAAISSFSTDHADGWFGDDHVRVAEYWTREVVEDDLYKLSDGTVMDSERLEIAKPLLEVMGITVTETRKIQSYKVTQRIISGAEVLETNKWAGEYIPIIPVYGDEVFEEGKRHLISMIRPAKDAQKMFNYWRTTTTELVALAPKAPFIGPVGAFSTDESKWATANTQTHAYIEYDGNNPPQRQPFAGVPAGALQEALNASDDMKSIIGLYDASLGAKSNETSGRAILARQREGDVSTFNFIDNLSKAIRHAGRVIVDLIPHVYNVPRVIRITHDDGTNESVRVNEPHRAEAANADNGMQQGAAMGETEQKEQQEYMAGVVKLYDLTVGKYDVTCTAGPSYATKRDESAQQMMQFLQSFPQAAPIIGDLVAKNLDWPGADDIADRLKAMLPPQLQGANPVVTQMQQQMQQMVQQAQQKIGQLEQQLAQAQSDHAAKAAESQIAAAEMQLKEREIAIAAEEARVSAALKEQELQIKQYDAETKRAQVIQTANDAQLAATESGAAAVVQSIVPMLDQLAADVQKVAHLNACIGEQMNAPRKIIRDGSGRPVGVEIGGVEKKLIMDDNGLIEGV